MSNSLCSLKSKNFVLFQLYFSRGKKFDRLNIALLTDLSKQANPDDLDVIIENLKRADITLQFLYGSKIFTLWYFDKKEFLCDTVSESGCLQEIVFVLIIDVSHSYANALLLFTQHS